jgi:hypothetical protein
MQLPNLHQQIKNLLSTRPSALQTYINWGTKTVQWVLTPVGTLLRSLIIVQGLDPNSNPEDKVKDRFARDLLSSFEKLDSKGYDADYDFSWAKKKLEDIRKSEHWTNLTPESFKRYTNLGNLNDTPAPAVDQAQPAISYDTPESRQELRNTLAQEAAQRQNAKEALTQPITGLNDTIDLTTDKNPIKELSELLGEDSVLTATLTAYDVKDALELLTKVASHLEEDFKETVDVKELFARGDYLQKVRESIRDYQKGAVSQEDFVEIVKAKPTVKAKGTRVKRAEPTVKSTRKIDVPTIKSTRKTANKDAVAISESISGQVEKLQKLISEGITSPSDFDSLVKEGLQKEVVSAWNEKYGKSSQTRSPTKFTGSFKRVSASTRK